MTSIRLLSDGDRFYIVMDHPTEEDKKAAMEFVSERMGMKVQEETPKGVLPVTVEKYTVPENAPEVKTEKLQIKVINTVNEFIEWFKRYPTIVGVDQRKLKNQMNFYIKSKIDTIIFNLIGEHGEYINYEDDGNQIENIDHDHYDESDGHNEQQTYHEDENVNNQEEIPEAQPKHPPRVSLAFRDARTRH